MMIRRLLCIAFTLSVASCMVGDATTTDEPPSKTTTVTISNSAGGRTDGTLSPRKVQMYRGDAVRVPFDCSEWTLDRCNIDIYLDAPVVHALFIDDLKVATMELTDPNG